MPNLFNEIEEQTGFKSYEAPLSNSLVAPQLTFYGISSNFEDFKTLVANKVETGTIVYLMDTGESTLYYKPTNTWY